MSKWVRLDRRYNQPFRLTGHAYRAIFKWFGLIVAWLIVNGFLAEAHLGFLFLATTGGLIWYAVYSARGGRPPRPRAVYTPPPPPAALRFNPAPGWPIPPAGWIAPPDWLPDPSWPPAPPGWPTRSPGHGAVPTPSTTSSFCAAGAIAARAPVGSSTRSRALHGVELGLENDSLRLPGSASYSPASRRAR